MASRFVLVFVGDQMIGSAVLEDADRSMAVASGVFLPNRNYSLELHSAEVDDKGISASPVALRILQDDRVELTCENALIIDWNQRSIEVDERELNVFGIDMTGFFGPDRQDAR